MKALPKCPTGIRGLDEITAGGLPRGRPTLVCGAAGSGKTLLAMEFLVRGARDFGEPGVFVAFEESATDLAANVASLGFDVPALVARKRLLIEEVVIRREEIVETGEYDLTGLLLRLDAAVKAVGARRIALDTLETLFGGFANGAILRAELVRLFRWIKDRGLTALVTAERGNGQLTRSGIEEYVSDCVIVLDQTMVEEVGTRHLRIAKYRGSAHGTNDYPFLIEGGGVAVVPITSLGMQHRVSTARVPTGIAGLDRMLGGRGFFRGSTAMVSGTAGTGKSSIAAHFVDAACARGERALYFGFEEAPAQVMRNMRSIGIDLGRWVRKGLLRFECSRPSARGLEAHLTALCRSVEAFAPRVVVLDPVTNFEAIGNPHAVKAMLTRFVDYLKSHGITALFTSLTTGGAQLEQTEIGISSLVDTWFTLRNLELAGERNRALYVIKSRGIAHSNQVREYLLTAGGARLADVFVGPQGILTGSGRLAEAARQREEAQREKDESARRRRALAHRRRALEDRIASMRAEFDAAAQEAAEDVEAEERRRRTESAGRERTAKARQS